MTTLDHTDEPLLAPAGGAMVTESDSVTVSHLVGWLHRLPLEELADHARTACASRVRFVAVVDQAHRSAGGPTGLNSTGRLDEPPGKGT